MRLHHVATWVADVDVAAEFWARYFGAVVGEKYSSKRQIGFVSRFATIGSPPLRIELMSKPGLQVSHVENCGWAHIALSLGSESAVDEAAARFGTEKMLLSGPRWTGDGYYEAVVGGPDGLIIEITA